MSRPTTDSSPRSGAVGTHRLMRAPAWTGGATAFVSSALADELPLLLAEASAPFGSSAAAIENAPGPQPWATPAVERPVILPSTVAECDRLLLGLAALASVAALPIARASAAVVRREAWRGFGYLNQSDFTRERLQRNPRWPREQSRLHAVLEKHPRLAEAFCGADGGEPLGQVATIEIGLVATAD